MMKKLLIANRGEIACRIMDTAHRMGIATVAVYSDADAKARHVEMADEAVHIGPAAAAESYLSIPRIFEAARLCGADAVHPGYGFLSENPDFVEAVRAAGLIFVGPSVEAIRAMGLKDNAKALMQEAGVPIVPGYHGSDQDPAHLAKEAAKIGYPVLIKARAGGGGKGMRLVERADDFAKALTSAAREAQSSFGDPACLIEKYIETPRHIEIQILGDHHGNVVHLFERDCSLQRRHQKVIEEAPAPGMRPEMRAAMGEAAVKAARAIGYAGAGTVEFIVDGSGGLSGDTFWFMEMNTRLQVEHPVTEAITGLDLVALQLEIASGAALPFAQDDLTIDGHAFEARLYAEDPSADFLPAPGLLEHLAFPPGVRIDTGVRAGDEISAHYDPMIAKITAHGKDRGQALATLSRALSETQIAGTRTNLAFLHALSTHGGFQAGDVDTGLIGREIDALTEAAAPDAAIRAAAMLTLAGARAAEGFGFRIWGAAQIYCDLLWQQTLYDAPLMSCGNGRYQLEGEALEIDRQGDLFWIAHGGTRTALRTFRGADAVWVFAAGRVFAFDIPRIAGAGQESGGDGINAPMPGVVRSVSAASGQAVTEGDPLLVLEAMKMEHVMRAPRDGIVAEVLTQEGAQVEANALLLRLEEGA